MANENSIIHRYNMRFLFKKKAYTFALHTFIESRAAQRYESCFSSEHRRFISNCSPANEAIHSYFSRQIGSGVN